MTLGAFVELVRPLNCLMAAIGVFIGYSISLHGIFFDAALGIAMAVAFLVCAAGMTINDVFDAAVDEKLRPDKPIPSKRVSERAALYYAGAMFALANTLALYYLPLVSFAIALLFTILLTAYSKFLPRIKYIGNWVVAAGTAFTLLFGASLAASYSVVLFFALSALFANAAREIVKDIEDIQQDTGFKVSLPMLAGEKRAEAAAFGCVLLAVVLGYVPWVALSFGGIGFLSLLSVANAGFLYSFKLVAAQDFGRAQKVHKAAMVAALAAFLAGVLE
jgi:geranylgeranylglycerol-phosphate geranylgeranyltransferase